MVVTKGVEIIAKRDKVTYASNISGKWVDYSIESNEGKILKDAFERFKKLQKEGAIISDVEINSLRQKFNVKDVVKFAPKPDETKYVVDAGINKNGYQTYIFGYSDDLNSWSLSAVPCPTTYERCEQLIAMAKRDIAEKQKGNMLKSRVQNTDFKIVEWAK